MGARSRSGVIWLGSWNPGQHFASLLLCVRRARKRSGSGFFSQASTVPDRFFLTSGPRHIREIVHGDRIIFRLNAGFLRFLCYLALSQRYTATHTLLEDLFELVLSTLDFEEALQDKEGCHSWNPIIKYDSELQDQCHRQSPTARYWSTNNTLMHHLVNDAA